MGFRTPGPATLDRKTGGLCEHLRVGPFVAEQLQEPTAHCREIHLRSSLVLGGWYGQPTCVVLRLTNMSLN